MGRDRPQSSFPQSPAAPARRQRRWPWLLLFLPVAVYAAWFGFAYANQEAMIFPGAGRLRANADGPSDAEIERVWITTPQGEQVEAWFKPGHGRSATSPGPAVIYFHGNYDLIDSRWSAVQPYVGLGLSALAVEYRGYGRSGGNPAQAGLIADAICFRDWLAARPEVEPNCIIYHGLSIGGAVATALAAERPPAALILECTFTSMTAIAQRYLLPGFLCRHPFETDRVVARLQCPILIEHGRHDRTIPISHGRRLHELAPGSRFIELDCGHGDFRTDWDEIRAFLADAGLVPRDIAEEP